MERLVDADALKQTFCAECDHSIKCEDCDIDYHFEHLAPTVDIDAITGSHERIGYDRGFSDGYAQATSEVKHGHWEGKPIAGYSTVRCSECGDVFMENSGKWNFCPNCGAYMEAKDGAERK